MQPTDRGLLALIRHEGVVPGPYLDVKQVWTFGIDHTAAAGPPDPVTMPRGMPAELDAGIREAFRVFHADLARYEAAVLRAVKVPLAPHEFDALVTLALRSRESLETNPHANEGPTRQSSSPFAGGRQFWST